MTSKQVHYKVVNHDIFREKHGLLKSPQFVKYGHLLLTSEFIAFMDFRIVCIEISQTMFRGQDWSPSGVCILPEQILLNDGNLHSNKTKIKANFFKNYILVFQ